ncbi:hypothetical protein UPYG_G00009360 [Umbra pygmaea]|uniref:ATP synthase F0 subunit 8 n=1 Tax=Umbra pygmaea TaxID=75934 RepID=A0ABD0XI74_UMBPY
MQNHFFVILFIYIYVYVYVYVYIYIYVCVCVCFCIGQFVWVLLCSMVVPMAKGKAVFSQIKEKILSVLSDDLWNFFLLFNFC